MEFIDNIVNNYENFDIDPITDKYVLKDEYRGYSYKDLIKADNYALNMLIYYILTLTFPLDLFTVKYKDLFPPISDDIKELFTEAFEDLDDVGNTFSRYKNYPYWVTYWTFGIIEEDKKVIDILEEMKRVTGYEYIMEF